MKRCISVFIFEVHRLNIFKDKKEKKSVFMALALCTFLLKYTIYIWSIMLEILKVNIDNSNTFCFV